MAYATQNKRVELSFAARLREIREQAREAYSAWRVYRRTLTELKSLSDRELNDLGINQSMIRRLALEAAYGKDV